MCLSDRDRIRVLRKICDGEIKGLNEKIKQIEIEFDRKIKEIQDACDHEDEGGMFVFTCKKCGWSDHYCDIL